jgi:hypothetical protein
MVKQSSIVLALLSENGNGSDVSHTFCRLVCASRKAIWLNDVGGATAMVRAVTNLIYVLLKLFDVIGSCLKVFAIAQIGELNDSSKFIVLISVVCPGAKRRRKNDEGKAQRESSYNGKMWA